MLPMPSFPNSRIDNGEVYGTHVARAKELGLGAILPCLFSTLKLGVRLCGTGKRPASSWNCSGVNLRSLGASPESDISRDLFWIWKLLILGCFALRAPLRSFKSLWIALVQGAALCQELVYAKGYMTNKWLVHVLFPVFKAERECGLVWSEVVQTNPHTPRQLSHWYGALAAVTSHRSALIRMARNQINQDSLSALGRSMTKWNIKARKIVQLFVSK